MNLGTKVGLSVVLTLGASVGMEQLTYARGDHRIRSEASERAEAAKCAAHLGLQEVVVTELNPDCLPYSYEISTDHIESTRFDAATNSTKTTEEDKYTLPTIAEFNKNTEIDTDAEIKSSDRRFAFGAGGFIAALGGMISTVVVMAAEQGKRDKQRREQQVPGTVEATV